VIVGLVIDQRDDKEKGRGKRGARKESGNGKKREGKWGIGTEGGKDILMQMQIINLPRYRIQ